MKKQPEPCGYSDLVWNGKNYQCSKCKKIMSKQWRKEFECEQSVARVKSLKELKNEDRNQ